MGLCLLSYILCKCWKCSVTLNDSIRFEIICWINRSPVEKLKMKNFKSFIQIDVKVR